MKKIIYLFIILLSFSSCRSKKKIVEREKINTQVEQTTSTEETIESAFSLSVSESLASESTTLEDSSIEEIEADSLGTVTLSVVKTDTGFVKTYTGVKKIKISQEKKETNESKKDNKITALEALETNTKKDESFIKINQETKKRKTNVEIKSTSTWFWIIIAILVLAYFANKRFKIL